MNYDQMSAAVESAEQTLRLADIATGKLACIIRGRLRTARVDHSILCDLKKELQRYDMRTGTWRD